MQTYSAESIPSQWPILLSRVTHGEQIVITEKEKPVARIIPVDSEQLLLAELQAFQQLMSTAPDLKLENGAIPVSPEEYSSQIRALRGFVPGIDTDVEDEDEPA